MENSQKQEIKDLLKPKLFDSIANQTGLSIQTIYAAFKENTLSQSTIEKIELKSKEVLKNHADSIYQYLNQ